MLLKLTTGNIEAACKLGNSLISDNPCADTNQNKMVVAISNGDFHFNDPFRYGKENYVLFFICINSKNNS